MEKGDAALLLDEYQPQNIVAEKRVARSTVPASHVQLACNGRHCAFPLNGNELCIWSLDPFAQQSLHLKGHHQPITAVTFGRRPTSLVVCSASRDYVILWHLGECMQSHQQGLQPRGKVLGTLLGTVLCLTFSPDDETVAVCADNKLYLLSSEHAAVLAEFEGHGGPVTSAEFIPWQTNLLASVSEDRTFRIWDSSTKTLVHQSSVLSGSPLLSLYIDEEYRQLVTASADGQIWLFSLEREHQYRCLIRCDLQKEKQHFYSKLSPGQKDDQSCENPSATCDSLEAALPVFRMEPLASPVNEELSFFPVITRRLWLGSSTGLFVINLANCELEAVLLYEDFSNLSIHVVGSCAMASASSGNLFCLLTSLFGNQIALLEINSIALVRIQQTRMHRRHIDISVIAQCPLLTTSPICRGISKKDDAKSLAKKNSGVKSTVKDQPLVFHNKIKSSGYTAAPRMKMFSAQTNTKKNSDLPLRKKSSGRGLKYEYPVDCPAPRNLHGQAVVANKPTSVCCMQYSGDGERLACALADSTLLVFNSNLIGTPAVYSGHDGAVTSVAWSLDKNWLVSSAADRTLRIWSVRNTEPVVIIAKEMFCKPVRCCQFYYMDKFILLSTGAEWQLLKYCIDTNKDDLKRYKERSMCKPVHKFHMASTQEITSLSAVNDFYSYIMLTAGSNRAVEVFDLNAGCSVATIPNAHSRSVHQICQNKGSAFSSQEPIFYNLFITTAVGDGIKLWDLRSLKCVRRFEGHLNRCHPCGIAVSPCGRFIASGSEDRCAYIYDIQSNMFSSKLSGHTESVINVAFSPSSPELTTATLDGKLKLFKP
ncbi:WD repeat-containing protein 27 [Lissotriton helveticus]